MTTMDRTDAAYIASYPSFLSLIISQDFHYPGFVLCSQALGHGGLQTHLILQQCVFDSPITITNPFNAPVCKISGLKDVRTRLHTVHFPVQQRIYFQCYVF